MHSDGENKGSVFSFTMNMQKIEDDHSSSCLDSNNIESLVDDISVTS